MKKSNQSHWVNLLLTVVLFAGIVGVSNLISVQLDWQLDLTQDKLNTLSDSTLQVIQSLPHPVKASAFYSKNYPTTTVIALLENFSRNSQGKFSYELIDYQRNPLAAREMDVVQDATIVVTMQDRRELVRFGSEQELLASILRLLDPSERSVYFLIGHGEYSLETSGNVTGYAALRKTLQAKNYNVRELSLLDAAEIPTDAQAIVIAGYQSALTTREVDLIANYLNNGGSLVLLLEPPSLTQIQDGQDPVVEYLDKEWGITAGSNMIIDPNADPPLIAITNAYKDHPIVNVLNDQRLTTIFPTARSIEIARVPETISHSVLAVTSKSAWAETNMDSITNSTAIPDVGVDSQGPITLGIAAQEFNADGRIVVIGDADFANDEYFDRFGNGDLMVNAISWAVKQEDRLNLNPKNQTARIMVTPTRTSMVMLFIGSVLLIPGLIILFGFINWNRRKRKG